MTSTSVSTEQLLAQIHETGYWRVLVHPTEFDAGRVATLDACWRIVEESRVWLRGWPYPDRESEYDQQGEGWIQSGIVDANQLELWRFYQSGQFVHHFAVDEDREPPSLDRREARAGAVLAGPRQLSYLNTLYILTEALEFVQRLAYRSILEPAATIRFELHGMKGRQLTASPGHRLRGQYRCETDVICWEQTHLAAALVATAPQVALDAAVHIFERFKWKDPSRAMLEDDQRRLLEHRL